MPIHADTAPSWLLTGWVRACHAEGATVSDAALLATAHDLLVLWDDPSRKYHCITHLIDVLRRVDELAQEAHDANAVRLAAWYHGAVFTADSVSAYENRAGENSAASANLAREQLAALGVPGANIERVAELVHAVHQQAGGAGPKDSDANVLLDADLAVLAESPQRYRAYMTAIRDEYCDIPEDDYITTRLRILEKIQGRKRIFLSPGAAAWEKQARENLEAEIVRLRAKLKK
ncbi:HD domain-containing protein [Rarobacter incanus]|uniref:Putative metal-dependent HD superfamily phosphohydrolase n=1 Tax=Rarobacter incanus TaxID=153494 RepID=A0A542SPY2_9MICO|nr:hypothetical protein [Rarobacter incanus]TQK76327.1 putative metal-dependent HD superfamily phosphohydrolase [Rarobacter incanus]